MPPFARTLCCAALASLWSLLASAQSSNDGTLAEVTIVANKPVGNTGIALNKFAGNVQTLSHDALSQDSIDLVQGLNQAVGSLNVNDTQGNPFAMDVNYRGFSASPVLGTPQGLSVYLDGMRINEPFGDIVSWDLLPGLIVDKVTVIPGSNPVYGLNTLGGAISMSSKDGQNLNGTQMGVTVGSFGRTSVDVEHGSHSEDDRLYLASALYNDAGWASYNPSRVRQLFAKYTRFGNNWDGALSVLYADNLLYGNQSVPQSMLDNAAQGYSHPDYTATQNLTLNLSGNLELDSSNTYAGNLYYRRLQRDILNSNINSLVSASTNDASCVGSGDCPASNLLAHALQDIVGANLQWSNTDPIWDHTQTLTLGLNLELSHTAFDNQGQDAYVDASHGMVATDAYMPQANIAADTTRWGLFATSTWDASEALSITASARYDYAQLNLDGWSCVSNDLCDNSATLASGQLTAVTGSNSYQRLNPSLGMTYVLAPQLIGFANYAEGLRTPSAIELACADPAVPCSGIPNAFGADPHLDAVVSKTYELGLRGNWGSQLKWRGALYQTRLENDILFNQSTLTSGYFSNVGATLRQGLELGLDGRTRAWDYALDLDWIQATYQSSFMVANPANSAASTPVQAGDFLPGIPAWVLKLRVGYALSGADRVGLALQAQGSTFARGDENNADVHGQIPGFATLAVDYHRSLGRSWSLTAGVNNLLDQRYANYGVLATNLLTTGAAEQFLSQGAPRSVYVGVQVRF